MRDRKPTQRRWLDRASRLLLACLLWTAALGCKDPAPERAPRLATPTPAEDHLVVFAAASLRDAFSALGESFERAHAGVELTFNFAGTQELRTQIEHGAAVDVFASADERHMSELARAGRVRAPRVFARNEPVVVVAKEQIGTLRAFSDLPHAQTIVIGAAQVPIGRYTRQVLDRASVSLDPHFRANVEARVVSHEPNVKQVLVKVMLGEADAAIVYRSDVNGTSRQVGVLAIPAEINVIAEYPIAVVAEAAHPTLAREWIAFVLSDAGRAALVRAGFLTPAATTGRQ